MKFYSCIEGWSIVDFLQELRKLLDQVPTGRVTSFKSLAEALGDLRAAKAVYRALVDEKPEGWHRVVRSDGILPFPNVATALQREGIKVVEGGVDGFENVVFMDFATSRPLEALREEQKALSSRLILHDNLGDLRSVVGFDVSYRGNTAHAAAVLMEWDSLRILEEVTLEVKAGFPYISTYLGYREFEPISLCYQRLRRKPSLMLVDGNGILHPVGFGIACLVGVKLERPTIGVAKSLLMGTVTKELDRKGSSSPVVHQDRLLGYAYKSSEGRPIFVSPGNMVSPATALELVRALCLDRSPEPLRLAHLASKKME